MLDENDAAQPTMILRVLQVFRFWGDVAIRDRSIQSKPAWMFPDVSRASPEVAVTGSDCLPDLTDVMSRVALVRGSRA